MTAKGRTIEQNIEDMRYDIRRNLPRASQSSDAVKFGRLVDHDELRKFREAHYKSWNGYARRIQRTEHGEVYEGYRNGYGNGYHKAEIPLAENLEELYFNKFGEGFDGTDIPPRIGEHYVCWKCGTKYAMSIVSLPLECRCGTETPLGRLVNAGYYKR